MIQVKFKKLNPNAVIPKVKHLGDGAMDGVAVSCKYDAENDRFIYGLGFATEFDPSWRARLVPRSSNTKTDAYLPNSTGLIEGTYRGEWMVIYKLRTRREDLFPGVDEDLAILEMENEMAPYSEGDKLIQIYFEKVEDVNWTEVDELSETERGADGGLIRNDKNFK